jgi:hypothetical protein
MTLLLPSPWSISILWLAVVPVASAACAALRLDGWDFAKPGAADRGDGYAVLSKRFAHAEVNAQLGHFADRRITAWLE